MSDAVLTQVQEADALQIQLARRDPNTFIEYVMRDDKTGQPLQQAPVHEAWQQLMTEHERLVVLASVEGGKSSQVSISRVLWELGKDPTLRCAIVSNTYEQATKLLRPIAKYIEQSAELKRVFPKLIPGEPWRDNAITVQRPTTSKDPSIQVLGVHGNILGARIDLLVLDDVLDYENTRTDAMRKELWDWYHATLTGRLTDKARVWIVGTPFHPQDVLHRFAAQPGWKALRYPVIDPATGLPRWPERWSMERINKRRDEMGPLEFSRQMLCQARDDASARFKVEWIDRCLARGRGKQQQSYGLSALPRGVKTYTGVDLAVQKHAHADLTVLFTIAVLLNGDREVINIESGRWSGPEIITHLVETHRRYLSSVMVENNASQQYIIDFAKGSLPGVRAFTTGRNKAHPEFGVESLAAEMANGKWIIPSGDGKLHPEITAWIQEMLHYSPEMHTGDRLMACWFAREAARTGAVKVQSSFIDIASR